MRKLIYREYIVYTFDELKEEVQNKVINEGYFKLLRNKTHIRTEEVKLREIAKQDTDSFWYFSDGRIAEVKI